MRTTIILALALSAGAVHADEWTGRDKALHFTAGATIGAISTLVFQDRDVGFALGTAAGLAKEMYDRRHCDRHTPSAKDFAVTMLGAFAGSRVAGLMITPKSISYRMEF